MNDRKTEEFEAGAEFVTGHGVCLECGDRILYGRQDKKFCCETCKNRYNNRKVRDSKITRVRILNALNKNYSILTYLLKMGVNDIEVSNLRHLGFDFGHITSFQKSRRFTELWCFDIKIVITGSQVTSIEQIQCIASVEKDANL